MLKPRMPEAAGETKTAAAGGSFIQAQPKFKVYFRSFGGKFGTKFRDKFRTVQPERRGRVDGKILVLEVWPSGLRHWS